MKILKLAAIVLTGTVFMFSGFVKGVDPLGSAYKFHDYFTAFGLQALNFLNLPLAILLCTTEFFAGFSVITGIMRKQGILLMTILMAIFTPLTLVLALTNPVSDCGCFGDAVKLTNWQTFIKNIILDIPVLFLLITEGRKSEAPLWRIGGKKIKSLNWGLGAVILFIGFCIYNLIYLPVIDFLPYKTGTRIADKMIVPEGASPNVYITTFIYEKDGVKKEFTLENYPANDTSWKFIDQRSVLKEKGYVPPVHDFAITDSAGEDITGRILGSKGYTLLMVSKKLRDAGKKHLAEGFETGKYVMNKGVQLYVLTASGMEEIKRYGSGLPVCTVDETTLKTMVRANPGYLLIKDGVVTDKWSWANLPGKEAIGFEK
jgi:uncharacterized membrane protein YphA (DoxX/SURF4 family)